MNKTDYEERQEARKERLEERAQKARGEASAASKASSALLPDFGQPILVGHHSEQRHRRAIERSNNLMRKGIAASEKADNLEHRAEGVGKAGISSDDPAAVTKLVAKLEKLDAQRTRMKEANVAWRKAGKPRSEGTESYRDGRPHEKWELTNLGATIRSTKKRIETLRASDAAPDREDIKGDGFTITEDRDENRVCFIFESKPNADTRQLLKGNGWKWNRRLVAWTRHNNSAGWTSAVYITTQLS